MVVIEAFTFRIQHKVICKVTARGEPMVTFYFSVLSFLITCQNLQQIVQHWGSPARVLGKYEEVAM